MSGRVSNELPVLSSNILEEIGNSGAKVTFGFPRWLRIFLQRDVIGLTLGSRVYLAETLAARRPDAVDRIIRHELAHVRQMQHLGVIAFLYNYYREYMELRFSGRSHFDAYSNISFEREAVAAENVNAGA